MAALLGFTDTEAKIILFVLFILFVGITYNYLKNVNNQSENATIGHSQQDSLFFASGNNQKKDTLNSKKQEKIVDSKQELLDFSKDEFLLDGDKHQKPKIGGININFASIKELTTLPGIGVKTAESIVQFRKMNGKFKAIAEIKKVKGIGEKKFLKIKKYIIVEN